MTQSSFLDFVLRLIFKIVTIQKPALFQSSDKVT